ncbi:energy transducer TonB [Winogradskyella vincentii]|uniref:Energy transducer TonB n=1 Tax=Winogradskyella vincentii TaxID=2877122 RepID=A0ABS7Y202_9FLAO|nr:energy transducer TonB [Winogradskyella vincentii]MCA0153956.1 energy transducer TonB [Winogradskyella vincentii]
MKYLETKHERNAARITTLISIILLLLLFVVGPQYLDPPEEYGVAVNFGTTDFGSGNRPLSQPKKAVKEQIEESQPETSKVAPTKAESKTEEVITEDNAEEIAIKKQKEAEAKAKAEAERIERQKREAEERKRREEEEKRKKLDNLIGGVKNSDGKTDGGEGRDNQNGNIGKVNGDPYAPSIFGGSGPGKHGIGFGLNGRKRLKFTRYQHECNETGLVVMRIFVNKQGKVTKAETYKGTDNTDPCLVEPARKIALSYRFNDVSNDPQAKELQVGFVSINFDLGQ